MSLTSSTLHIVREGEVVYTAFPSFERTGKVHHGFSTRFGGVSRGEFATMNLSFHRGDDPEAVTENFLRMGRALGVYMGDTVFSDQVHGDRILYVDQQYRGSGFTRPEQVEEVDGLVTNRRHVVLVTFHADCVPLFFLDPVREAIGLAHAGWKGTLLKIGGSMVRKMEEEFGSDPADLLVGIGPSIGPCCFETGSDVYERFQKVFGRQSRQLIRAAEDPEKRYVDLWSANVLALTEAGVARQHITVTDLCTRCHPEAFHSHRYAGNARGSQAAFLELY